MKYSQTPGLEHRLQRLPETTRQLPPGFPRNSSHGMEECVFDLRQRIPLSNRDETRRLRIDKTNDLIACVLSLVDGYQLAIPVQWRRRDRQGRVRRNGEPSWNRIRARSWRRGERVHVAAHVRLSWMNVGIRATLGGWTMRVVVGGRMERRGKWVNGGLVVPARPQRTQDRGGRRVRLIVRLIRGVPG